MESRMADFVYGVLEKSRNYIFERNTKLDSNKNKNTGKKSKQKKVKEEKKEKRRITFKPPKKDLLERLFLSNLTTC
jgi:hypothetical protein